MISDDRQPFRDEAVQQAFPGPHREVPIGVVNALRLRETVGYRIVERDVSGQTPAAIEQKRHMPRGVAGREKGLNAGEEFFLVAQQADAIA